MNILKSDLNTKKTHEIKMYAEIKEFICKNR